MKQEESYMETEKNYETKTGAWKPNYTSMVFHPILKKGLQFGLFSLLIWGLISTSFYVNDIGSINTYLFTGIPFIVLFLAVILVTGYWNHIRWTKTEYRLSDDRVRVKTGSPFSDSDAEVLWSKLVQARLDISFIQQVLFGTGNILLEAAGQSETEIIFWEVEAPERMFERILDHLDEPVPRREDQHHVTYTQSRKGIAVDFLLWNVPIILLALLAIWALKTFGVFTMEWLLIPGSILVFGNAPILYHTLKNLNTKYLIFKHYTEKEVHFLGRNRSLLPLSVLTDVHYQSPLHKRILGISNIFPSVPGLGDRVSFKNLKNGDELHEFLQKQSDQIKGIDQNDNRETTGTLNARPQFQSFIAFPVFLFSLGIAASYGVYQGIPKIDVDFLQGYGSAILSSFPAFLGSLYLVWTLLKWTSISFEVSGNRVEYMFSLVHQSSTRLSMDKIMAVIQKQGIIERLFGAFTLKFHSFGRADDINFDMIEDTNKHADLLRHILDMKGYDSSTPNKTIRPTLSTWSGLLLQHLTVLIFLPLSLLLITGLLPIVSRNWTFISAAGTSIIPWSLVFTGAVWGMLLAYYTYYYRNCVSLELHDDSLIYREGFFQLNTIYICYDDIRNVEYGKEPFSQDGWLRVDYAGGTIDESGNQPEHSSRRGFLFNHLEQVKTTARVLENVFSGKTPPDQFEHQVRTGTERTEEVLYTIRPSSPPFAGLGVFLALVFYAIFYLKLGDVEYVRQLSTGVHACILIGSMGILGTILWAYSRTMSYSIYEEKIEYERWLLFTRTTSIKFLNIDNIKINQNFYEKLFDTGTIQIMTTGGTGVEMALEFIRNYKNVYERLQEIYNDAQSRKQP